MNSYFAFAGLELWHVAGWTMLHFLWLGALVGVVALVARRVLDRARPNIRYFAALGCLTLLAALPIGIAHWLITHPSLLQQASSSGINPAVDELITQRLVIENEKIRISDTADQTIIGLSETASKAPTTIAFTEGKLSPRVRRMSLDALGFVVRYLPWLWILGTPLTLAMLAAGIVGTKRMQSTSCAIEDQRITELLARLTKSLGVGRRVSIAICERIASPVLVGILRPIILLPPAAITGWSPDEIEMVLLHELAHVHRWDNLVNFLQRMIESLLFFHPVVWLVSNWARREREACCDAIVVHRTKRPHAYAELLIAVAAQMPRSVLFQPAASSAMAAGPLRRRIRRILQLEDDPMLVSGKSFAVMLAGMLVASTLAVLYLPTIGQAEESKAKRQAATGSPADTLGQVSPFGPATNGTNEKFPSLDEQKLADQVWKRLGLELESIGDDELKRVKDFGYDGGLRVSGKPNVIVKLAVDQASEGILTGDILVGLHVWPTTKLKDVADILNRNDLAELSPLKFYVVRHETIGGPSKAPITRDALRSGRITVQFKDKTSAGERDAQSPAATYVVATPSNPFAAANRGEIEALRQHVKIIESQFKRIDALYKTGSRFVIKHDRELAAYELALAQGELVLAEGNPARAVDKFEVARTHAQNALEAATADYESGRLTYDFAVSAARNLANIKRRIAQMQATEASPAPLAAPGAGPRDSNSPPAAPKAPSTTADAPAYLLPTPEEEADRATPPREAAEDIAAPPIEVSDLFGAEPAQSAGATQGKSALRYEGRTFEEWRLQWLSDSPDSRRQLDAFKAMEAFAAAGYGKDAANAILFGVHSQSALVAQHARKYLKNLSPTESRALVARLINELDNDLSPNRRIRSIRALAAIGPGAESALDILKERLASDDPEERIAAAAAIKMIVGKDQYQKPVADVLGDELGITVQKTPSGVWGALPRADAKDDGQAFGKFTDDVIKEQEKLFPPEK